MEKTKIIIMFVAVVLLLGIFFMGSSLVNPEKQEVIVEGSSWGIGSEDPDSITPDNEESPVPNVPEKLKADTFEGTLQEVNTGCFADGECFIVVDGIHITTLMGWSRDTVGSVVGVDGFGDLENHIGALIEVYAQDLSDGTFTLYGSDGFYIKLLDEAGVVSKIGETASAFSVRLTPHEVIEDSRCPVDVTCIQAGTVRVATTLENGLGTSEQVFVLGQPVTTEAEIVTLVRVEPQAVSTSDIGDGDYIFYFKIKKR